MIVKIYPLVIWNHGKEDRSIITGFHIEVFRLPRTSIGDRHPRLLSTPHISLDRKVSIDDAIYEYNKSGSNPRKFTKYDLIEAMFNSMVNLFGIDVDIWYEESWGTSGTRFEILNDEIRNAPDMEKEIRNVLGIIRFHIKKTWYPHEL